MRRRRAVVFLGFMAVMANAVVAAPAGLELRSIPLVSIQGDGRPGLPLPGTEGVEDVLAEARAAFRQGDHLQARGRFERALRLDPDVREARVVVAYYEQQMGDLRRAREMFERLAEEDPDDDYACREALKCALREGDLDASRIALERFERFGGGGLEEERSILDALARGRRRGEKLARSHARWWGVLVAFAVLAWIGTARVLPWSMRFGSRSMDA